MPRILTRCPETNHVVPTNMTMDAGTFRIIQILGHTFQCPVCDQLHAWEKKDAWVASGDEPYAQGGPMEERRQSAAP